MKLFQQLFILSLISCSFAYTSSDDESPTSASAASSKSSSQSNPEEGMVLDNRAVYETELAVHAVRAETPAPDFADDLPIDLPYRGSVIGENQTELRGDGIYQLKGTDEYVIRV